MTAGALSGRPCTSYPIFGVDSDSLAGVILVRGLVPLLAVLVLAALPGVASAQTLTAVAGQEAVVSGGSWQDGTSVEVAGCGAETVTATVNDDGSFRVPIDVPPSQPAGECTVTVTGTDENGEQRTVSSQVLVSAAPGATPAPAPATTGAPATPPAALAQGGLPASSAGLLALALLALGGAMLRQTRPSQR